VSAELDVESIETMLRTRRTYVGGQIEQLEYEVDAMHDRTAERTAPCGGHVDMERVVVTAPCREPLLGALVHDRLADTSDGLDGH
jgi:hypothetical protein